MRTFFTTNTPSSHNFISSPPLPSEAFILQPSLDAATLSTQTQQYSNSGTNTPSPITGFTAGQVFSAAKKDWRAGAPGHEKISMPPALGTSSKARQDHEKHWALQHPFIPVSQSGEIVRGHVVTRKPLEEHHLNAAAYGAFKKGARVEKKSTYVHVNDLKPVTPNTPVGLYSLEGLEQLKADVSNLALVHPYIAPASEARGKGKVARKNPDLNKRYRASGKAHM